MASLLMKAIKLLRKSSCKRLKSFYPDINLVYTTVAHYPFLKGLNAHYHIMSEEDYNTAIKENK